MFLLVFVCVRACVSVYVHVDRCAHVCVGVGIRMCMCVCTHVCALSGIDGS